MKENINAKVIEDKVRHILTDRLGIDVGNIKTSSLLKDDLNIDSFNSLRVIFEVEDIFDISVPPTEVTDIKTISDIVNYIHKRLTS